MPTPTNSSPHPPINAACHWFPGHPTSVRDVRRFITNRLEDCPRKDDAALLASELATNAIEHSLSGNWTTGFLVSIEHTTSEGVRVAVQDAGSWESSPAMTEPSPGAEHGRGLYLVEVIADRWSAAKGRPGDQTVWFELDCA
ncbi:anti-sigma regulatory factor (Ser/Thr protein kinase) [Spinactinospora alkalitolerans]|uniref:Anti-sigma regulatory factor (Ser/Thr protein kinase) n=1 Tax=Spinactinospora alkalitolerans TaxID=687207 RepID=A0A852U448_9ACTN|nr:ATP-binding protein [Spinactinospora alkalitolerans]NYE50275.1 anti-sigma regulatory factor (Ser/Thr protein kinase) [Spinactinospora alkalitolerans]